jgi:peptide/nickel transport system substrate-binding protein
MTQHRITHRCAKALAVLASVSAAHAADLRIGLAAPATSMDPHFFNAAPNATVASHVFDRLTSRTPDAKLIPWLAESWKPVDKRPGSSVSARRHVP